MNGIKHLLSRLSLFLVFMLAFSTACKDDFNSSIPYVDVNFSISMSNYNDLTVVGVPVFINGGYGGIVVINVFDSYYAFDVTCPYEVDLNCRVEPDGSPVVTCPCCETQYNLLEGAYAFDGPSSEPLRPYRVTRSGNRLYFSSVR